MVAFQMLLYFVLFPSSSSSFPPHFSTLIIASFIFPSPMQVDVQEWTVTQIIINAIGAGILPGLVFRAAAACLLPDVEERWKVLLMNHSAI
jgi:hypothetical protein